VFSSAQEEALFQAIRRGVWTGRGGSIDEQASARLQRDADASALAPGAFVMSLPRVSLMSVERATTDQTCSRCCVVSSLREPGGSRGAANAHGHSGQDRVDEHYLHVRLARHRSLDLESEHAAIEVRGVQAPVRISTAHGSVFILDSGGPVDVEARDDGSILWSGVRGGVTLEADVGLCLRLPGPTFDGHVIGKARGAAVLFVPEAFKGAISVDIAASRGARIHALRRPPLREWASGTRRRLKLGAGSQAASVTSVAGDIDIYWGRRPTTTAGSTTNVQEVQ
jgi:hypothetical protein